MDITVPSLGESESEATLISWLKNVGDEVLVDDVMAEIESDKITMEITAYESGVLTEIRREAGSSVEPGEVIGVLDTSVTVAQKEKKSAKKAAVAQKVEVLVTPKASKEALQEAKAVVKTMKKPVTKPLSKDVVSVGEGRLSERVPMSRLRKRIATRLKESQNTAAMLTTFNEVNMQTVMDMRAKYQTTFTEKYSTKLGFMSFFVKACAYASSKYPVINAYIDGEDVVYHNYMDVGVAVSTDKGLIVPVLRDVGMMGFAEVEIGVGELAKKAREGGLMPDDLKGGTFTITNGGVFGSLLSTPILNTPQSAILGMHTIQKRVVVEHDQMVIRPMMYLALSYDHRLIDGKDAVGFLVSVKECLEDFGGILLDI